MPYNTSLNLTRHVGASRLVARRLAPKQGSKTGVRLHFSKLHSDPLFCYFVDPAWPAAVSDPATLLKISANQDKRIEPTIGELPVVLESALEEVHRPIRQDREIVLTVTRPRGEPLAEFDADTLQYLIPTTVPNKTGVRLHFSKLHSDPYFASSRRGSGTVSGALAAANSGWEDADIVIVAAGEPGCQIRRRV